MLRGFIESGRIWVIVVVALLLLNVGVCAVTVVAATSDPVASAVEPEYYQRAVDWDKTRARWPATDKLGWKLQIHDLGAGVVEIRATDAQTGVALTGVRGRIVGKHAGDTLVTLEGQLQPDAQGRLRWSPGELTPGLWSVKVWLERGDERAVGSQNVMVGG